MSQADYLYSLLNGYKDFPDDYEASEGMYYNIFYPGNQIAMPSPIMDDIVEYDDGTEATYCPRRSCGGRSVRDHDSRADITRW